MLNRIKHRSVGIFFDVACLEKTSSFASVAIQVLFSSVMQPTGALSKKFGARFIKTVRELAKNCGAHFLKTAV